MKSHMTGPWTLPTAGPTFPDYRQSWMSAASGIVGIGVWFRCRTDIEHRIREAKLGAGLRHLPSEGAGRASGRPGDPSESARDCPRERRCTVALEPRTIGPAVGAPWSGEINTSGRGPKFGPM